MPSQTLEGPLALAMGMVTPRYCCSLNIAFSFMRFSVRALARLAWDFIFDDVSTHHPFWRARIRRAGPIARHVIFAYCSSMLFFFVACSLLALTASLMGILFGSFAKALLSCLFWSFWLYFGKLQKKVLSCVIVMFFCTAYTSSIAIFQHNQVSPPSSRVAAMQPNRRNEV